MLPWRSLVACLCAGAILAGLAAPLAAIEGERQVRARIYERLMAEILATGVESATDEARWSIGKDNPYRSIDGDKVISACIDWDASTPERAAWDGYAFFYDTAGRRTSGDPATLRRLEARADAYCRRYEALSDCYCQLVDRNGDNVLELPEWFRRAYTALSARGQVVIPPRRPRAREG